MHSATKPILHGIFNHCSDDKLRRTLEHTEGLAYTGSKADTYCESCAKAKIRKRGLHSNSISLGEPGEDLCQSNDDSHEIVRDWEAEVPGVEVDLGAKLWTKEPDTLRPYKSYPCSVRGGKQVCFLLVDKAGLAVHTIDVRTKSNNGRALREIVTSEGIHKLPYKRTVFADNCDSMRHVKKAAISMGLDFQPLPPKEQALNLAETYINHIFHAALSHVIHSGRKSKYFAYAVHYITCTYVRTHAHGVYGIPWVENSVRVLPWPETRRIALTYVGQQMRCVGLARCT